MKLSEFAYKLPEGAVQQLPPKERDEARLTIKSINLYFLTIVC